MRNDVPAERLSREEFLKKQRARLELYFSLTANEHEAREQFEKLALDTYDQIASIERYISPFSIEAESAFNFANAGENLRKCVSLGLLRRWQAWKGSYQGLLDRNPRLALYDLMHGIGETHSSSSWPYGLEPAISDWIDSGQREPMPFDDRRAVVTPAFYERLRLARREAAGFLYLRDGREPGVTFLPEADWQREKARQEEERAARIRQAEQLRNSAERFQTRMAEILAEAQKDTVFWEALRIWEMARESQRPNSTFPDRRDRLVGPIAIARSAENPDAKGSDPDAIPLDTLLADAVERIRQSEDGQIGLTIALTVAILRGAMRRELAFDDVLVWPAGPSLGEGRL